MTTPNHHGPRPREDTMTTLNATLRDTIALVGGGIFPTTDPAHETVVRAVIDDLRAADPDDVINSFLGLTVVLVERLAQLTNNTPESYWNRTAAEISAHLAELENQA
ncbi:hypothetical protein ACWEQO_29030 [Streptomyces sp. NPDC004051]